MWDFGVQISTGQLSRIITEGKEKFHAEKEEILRVGLEVSAYINVDDTGARHNGKNGYCTHVGNEFFAWFSSTESKSRVNFLKLLQTSGTIDYVIDDVAREYMEAQNLPRAPRMLFEQNKVFIDKVSWEAYLQELEITSGRHQKFDEIFKQKTCFQTLNLALHHCLTLYVQKHKLLDTSVTT